MCPRPCHVLFFDQIEVAQCEECSAQCASCGNGFPLEHLLASVFDTDQKTFRFGGVSKLAMALANQLIEDFHVEVPG